MAGIKKTNAMRMLDKENIPYEAREYEYDENDLDGMDVAFIATGHAGTDVRIAGMCRRRNISRRWQRRSWVW